jgi:hypothetical protein
MRKEKKIKGKEKEKGRERGLVEAKHISTGAGTRYKCALHISTG